MSVNFNESFVDELIMTSILDSDGCYCATLINNSKATFSDFSLCFSVLSPIKAINNCEIVKQIGSYVELKKTPASILKPGDAWSFKYEHKPQVKTTINLSWGAQGVYLQSKDEIIKLKQHELTFSQDYVCRAINSTAQPSINTEETLKLIPHPQVWDASNGICDLSNIIIGACWKNTKIIDNAYKSAYNLNNRLNLNILNADKINKDSDTVPILSFSFEELAPSAYCLLIKPDNIKIAAADEAGFFYGLISLLQLYKNYQGLLPCGSIQDSPRFTWRGQHLDCARHFYKVDTILKLLDFMAFFKLNKFHWHATDDEAFRFMLNSAPDLATKTAHRGHGQVVPAFFGSGPEPTGGYYDANDISAVIKHADSNYIEVMPEIDLPAHNWAMTKIYPNVRDKADKSIEFSVQGYYNNTINPAIAETWKLVEALIDDICALFPGKYIHIGGDEVPPNCWELSPAIQELKQKHSLANNKDIVSWFVNRLALQINKHNKIAGAYQETNNGIHNEAQQEKLLFAWLDLESGQEAARNGDKVVLCAAQHLYFDLAQSASTQDRGASWAGIVDLEKTINWRPVPLNEPELEKNIMGMQGYLWGETITEDKQMWKMINPRLLGLAESAWTNESSKRSVEQFYNLVKNDFQNLFEHIGWDYHKKSLRELR